MIFGCADCFTSLIWRYLAQLEEIVILMEKGFTGNCVVISINFMF